MPEESAAGVPRKALKFVGNVAEGTYVPGIPAHDLTQAQVETWLRDDLYLEALASGAYEEATKTEAKAMEAAASDDADAESPKRRSAKKEE